MRISTKTHFAILIIAMLILLIVQLRLVYNTYSLKDKQYNLEEKSLINEVYSAHIRNDKVFPGGQKIIDRYINHNITSLELLYKQNNELFLHKSQLILDSLFSEMRKQSNMDSLFAEILAKNNLPPDLEYLLTINDLKITEDGKNYISIFNPTKKYPKVKSPIHPEVGVIIGGKLAFPNIENKTSGYVVSSPTQHSYQIAFSLYVDRPDRAWLLFKSMLPTLMLVAISLLGIASISYITFRNWVRQKKEADLKSDFINSITHEFNTPIATILVANKSLRNKDIIDKKENIPPLTQIIDRQAIRLQTLINQALDISQMHKTMHKNEHELNDLVKEVVDDYRLKVGETSSITFTASVPVKMKLDRFLFTTMLNNIFENAIKYNTKRHKEIAVTVEIAANKIMLKIKDNGVGISAEMKHRIFDKFFRGNTNIPGLGLGLFYVKECLEAHQWSLTINSKEEKGSEFIIFMAKN